MLEFGADDGSADLGSSSEVSERHEETTGKTHEADARLSRAFNSLEQDGLIVQTIAQDEQIGAGTVAEVARYLPVIRDAFSEAFDCESASCAITLTSDSSEDASDFPVYVGLDASGSDPERVSAARASGGRSRFYRKLSDILPSPLLDLVGFRFEFPHVGSR